MIEKEEFKQIDFFLFPGTIDSWENQATFFFDLPQKIFEENFYFKLLEEIPNEIDVTQIEKDVCLFFFSFSLLFLILLPFLVF